MSEENVEVVRQPLGLRVHSRRRLVEHLVLRAPRTGALMARAIFRLSPRSWLRQKMLRWSLRVGFEAANRGDWEAAFATIPDDFEAIPPPDLVRLGFAPVYRGRADRLRYQLAWIAELGDFQQALEELIDLGDRFLVLGHMTGSGTASGAVFESEIAYLWTQSGGQLIREESFRSHQEALEAAGLSE